MKDVKLIICDLDGTLFDWSNRTLSEENKKMMHYLHEKGVDLIFYKKQILCTT